MDNPFSTSIFTITQEDSITGKRNKPASDAVHDGIYILVSELAPNSQNKNKYEYRVGQSSNVWRYPYAIRTKQTVAIYRVTFETIPFTLIEYYTIAILVGAILEPQQYAQYIPLEEHFSEQDIFSYYYLQAMADNIVEAL
jgi:hypothetical protein